ncbi:unnamed protein product [Adineta ricciae]|uniref:Uncharacterized protein n=1 Tax=Adineta ricciae TaxID=249248 RepID=A0A813ZXG8_ADIRI|nr:unnamed protein product [Adineta ricciae]
MSKTTASKKKTAFIEPLPTLPETRSIQPLVQCGILYLGTCPTTNSRRGLDAIQEPFSYQYPVDGTNTARGVDGVLSVFENGVQLTFTRQSEAAVFFPISSLVYCASLRFTVIRNDRTKPKGSIYWRFMPLEAASTGENKHPPLFCAVFQRTHILPGDECHCFITKTAESALALVQAMSRIYKSMQSDFKSSKSPIFYQLDHLGRKIKETTNTIYLSPANDEDGQLNRANPIQLKDEHTARKYLLNPSYGGYYYRTDASLIEQWQLWDDDDVSGCRPHPPDSPFGLHEGLYHDDTTQEIRRCLRHMDSEENLCSCSCSSDKSCSSSSVSTQYTRRKSRQRRSKRQSSPTDTDQFEMSFSQLVASTFEPIRPNTTSKSKRKRRKPIIIEKVLPKPVPCTSGVNMRSSEQPEDPSRSHPKSELVYIPSSDTSCFSYDVNEYGEKITKEGNRIIFMDVVRPSKKINFADPPSYIPVTPDKPRRRRRPKSARHIPVIDLQQLDKLINEQQSKAQRRASLQSEHTVSHDLHQENYLATPDMLDILNKFFGLNFESRFYSNDKEIQTTIDYVTLHGQKEQEQKRKSSSKSSTASSKSGIRLHHNRSTITPATREHSIHSLQEQLTIPSPLHSQLSSINKQKSPPAPSILTDQKLDQYISDIYGTPDSTNSITSSSHHPEQQVANQAAVLNAGYISAFRYMQSSMNANYLNSFHHAY